MKTIRSISLLIFVTLQLLCVSVIPIRADQDISSTFEEANIAYSGGDYSTAITQFEDITKEAGYSGSVLFNLGNSYARDGQVGKAVVNYQRALLITPSDSDILGNLQLVKKESGLFLKERSRFEKIVHSLTFNQWTILVLISLVVLAAINIIPLLHPISKKSSLISGGVCCILVCLFTIGSYASYQRFNPSIVISPETRLLISPFKTAGSIGTIQEGRQVYPLKTHKAYTYVIDETDRKGWIATDSIEAVCNPEEKN